MIGDYKGEVKYRVITALLQAYHDILDYDGMRSILKEAEMLYLKNIKDENQDQMLDFFSFKKIISAQNCLLYDSSRLLFEIGKKFSFYLYPYGKNFEEIVVDINRLIVADWKVEITNRNDDIISILIQKCIFCSEIGVPCDLFEGFLVHSLEKILPSEYRVTHFGDKKAINDPNHNTFILKLKIEKKP